MIEGRGGGGESGIRGIGKKRDWKRGGGVVKKFPKQVSFPVLFSFFF